MLKTEETKKPYLPQCSMLCDSKLSKKLEKYPLVDELWNKHSTNLVIGRPGSGKSSFLYSLIAGPLKKKFHTIFVFMPRASMMSMNDPIYDTLPEDQKFDELTEDNLGYVLDRIKNEDKKFNNCIIMDDQAAHLKNKEIAKMMKEIMFNKRHYRTSLFFCVQTFFSCPKDAIRRSFDNLVLFKCSKDELKNIFEECIEAKSKYRDEIAELVFDEPYKFLACNLINQKMFDGWDKIIFPDD